MQIKDSSIIPVENIGQNILVFRGQKVMVDEDLARLYGISTIRLNEQVRRNKDRFPEEFMFQLNKSEYESLRSQFASSKSGRGGRRYLPYVFTEHGVAMLSSILRSPKAVQMNILIIRAFIRIREILSSNREMAAKIEALEYEQKLQNKHINNINEIIHKLLDEPVKPKEKLGFCTS